MGVSKVAKSLYLQGAAKALIFPVVQQFTQAFVQALQMPDGPSSDSGLKMEVLKVSEQPITAPRLSLLFHFHQNLCPLFSSPPRQ